VPVAPCNAARAEYGLKYALNPEMIEGARRRLAGFTNVALYVGNGRDLASVADASADLVFSYIVFQHIPSREVIESYAAEAARVLRDGGAFKFQVNGDQSPDYASHPRDTWFGETFSETEALEMLARCGLFAISLEGSGTQYFVITARKGSPRPKGYVLPGEQWAAPLLLEGFGSAVGRSWRPMDARARVRLEGRGPRLYLGLYFWPESFRHRVHLSGREFEVASPGDHYFECAPAVETDEVEIWIEPPPSRAPAFRVLGRY
jgi:SAM-dependent methyltransferase